MTPVKRMARALYIWKDDNPKRARIRQEYWDDPANESGWHEEYMHQARAALVALREPSPAMEDAMSPYIIDEGVTPADCWHDAIDAALKEGVGG